MLHIELGKGRIAMVEINKADFEDILFCNDRMVVQNFVKSGGEHKAQLFDEYHELLAERIVTEYNGHVDVMYYKSTWL
jgi:hypothetical protein